MAATITWTAPDGADHKVEFHSHRCVTCTRTHCWWCVNPRSDEEPDDPELELCRSHWAEYEGLSLDGLDHMEAEERADRL